MRHREHTSHASMRILKAIPQTDDALGDLRWRLQKQHAMIRTVDPRHTRQVCAAIAATLGDMLHELQRDFVAEEHNGFIRIRWETDGHVQHTDLCMALAMAIEAVLEVAPLETT